MIDALVVLGVSAVCYISAFGKKIGRAWGIVYLLIYAVYLAYIIMRDLA